MWTVLERVVKDRRSNGIVVPGILHLGDQVYMDSGAYTGARTSPFAAWLDRLSQAGATTKEDVAEFDIEILRDFQEVYRRTWMFPPTRRVMAKVSSVLMLPDDHEVADDWGDRSGDSWDGVAAPGSETAPGIRQILALYARECFRMYQMSLRGRTRGRPHVSTLYSTMP